MKTTNPEPVAETVTRYALTHLGTSGVRALSRGNQGRCHFNTEEEGNAYLSAFLANNSRDTLAQIFGPQALNTFRILPVECYAHGDAKRCYFGRYMPLEWGKAKPPQFQVYDTETHAFLLEGVGYSDFIECAQVCDSLNGYAFA